MNKLVKFIMLVVFRYVLICFSYNNMFLKLLLLIRVFVYVYCYVFLGSGLGGRFEFKC